MICVIIVVACHRSQL